MINYDLMRDYHNHGYDNFDFGHKLKDIMHCAGVNASQLAKKIKTTTKRINEILDNKSTPTLKEIEYISYALGVYPDNLLDHDIKESLSEEIRKEIRAKEQPKE